MMHGTAGRQRNLVKPTYAVTIFMLIIGQLQVAAFMEIKALKTFLQTRYFLSLILFFLSFLSIQLYGFFFRLIVTQSIWMRLLAGLWTYEVNTLSVMKPSRPAPYFAFIVSFVYTYLMMLIGAIYGKAAKTHKRGLFMSRQKVVLWSERIFVVTCFGTYVSDEMRDERIEIYMLVAYMIMSNVFVIIFAASLRRPAFYNHHTRGDYVLIGQLYYLNFFALYMSIVWTIDSLLDLTMWDSHVIFKILMGQRSV